MSRRQLGAYEPDPSPLREQAPTEDGPFADSIGPVVPRTGFEPVISTLKGWRPRPLDERGVRPQYSARPRAASGSGARGVLVAAGGAEGDVGEAHVAAVVAQPAAGAAQEAHA